MAFKVYFECVPFCRWFHSSFHQSSPRPNWTYLWRCFIQPKPIKYLPQKLQAWTSLVKGIITFSLPHGLPIVQKVTRWISGLLIRLLYLRLVQTCCVKCSRIESFLAPCIFCIHKKSDYPTTQMHANYTGLNEPLGGFLFKWEEGIMVSTFYQSCGCFKHWDRSIYREEEICCGYS